MRRDGLLWLCVLLLAVPLLLLSCGSSGGGSKPAADGDTEANEGEGESTKAALGESCTRNLDCGSQLCLGLPSGKVCSRVCSRDEDCNADWAGSSCYTIGEQNLCVMLPDETEGDGDRDSDADAVCQDEGEGSTRCNGLVYQTCIKNKWVDSKTCGQINPYEKCSVEAEGCLFVPPDGDADGEIGACTSEGKATTPARLSISAEEFFTMQSPNLSTPLDKAKICTSDNSAAFSDGTYLCLDIESADITYIGSELVFTFLASGEGNYPYFIKLDLVCGKDKWGTFSLFMDDQTTAVPIYSSTATETKFDEMCKTSDFPGGIYYDEYKLPKVLFGPVCLTNGYHKLRMRVVQGNNPNSKGFKLGLDWVTIFGDSTSI